MQPSIAVVVDQHAEDAAVLRNTRAYLLGASQVRLNHLARLDERLAAHLDGLSVAGAQGWAAAAQALEKPDRGQAFVATVCAIEERDARRLDVLLATAEALPESLDGLDSAFGWVSASALRGITGSLLASQDAFRRRVGIVACNLHRVDPGAALAEAVADDDPGLRAQAWRAAGELARRDLLGASVAALSDADAACAFQAARAAVLLGDRGDAVQALLRIAMADGPHRMDALRLLLKLLDLPQALPILRTLTDAPGQAKALVRCVGVAGDPHFMEWLLGRMDDPLLSRQAGEAFCMITGLDLAWLDLECKRPAGFEPGPDDTAGNEDVEVDEDEDLPWPDPVKLRAWWGANAHRFASGTRYFMGERLSADLCVRVLREGFQRQRIAAAQHLCFLNPGTRLFPTSAPAWRQQRWLDASSNA